MKFQTPMFFGLGVLSSAPTLLVRIAVLTTGRFALATAHFARLSLGHGRLG
jgi:hypothetical protein